MVKLPACWPGGGIIMPSIIDDRLNQRYNLIPDIDPELREVVRVNSRLDTLMSVNFEIIANPAEVAKIYREIISILISYDFQDGWIQKIVLVYRNGETWEEWGHIQRIIEGIRRDIEIREQKEKKQREYEEAIKKEKQVPSQFPFSVKNYTVKETGICKTEKHKNFDGEYEEVEVQLTPTPCYISAIGNNIDTGEISYKLHIKNIMGNEIDIWKKPGELLKRVEVLKLQDEIHFQEPVAKELMNYFDESILKYRSSFPIEITADTNGWKNNYSLFVIGEKAIKEDDVGKVTHISDEMKNKYVSKGDKEEWKKELKDLLDYDLVRLKMYATVGAFIIRFTPIETFLIHNYEESSGGKTLSMRIAASLIGNPDKNGIIESANISQAGFELSLESRSDTPVYWDETSANPDFIKGVYMLGNEKGKGRGTKDLKYRDGGSWKTIAQSTGEEPLTQGMTVKTGNQTRVIEIHDRLPKLEKEYIENINMSLKSNYGLFLDEIIQEIFKVKDKIQYLYGSYSRYLGKPINEFAGRKQGYFTVLMVAGSLLEDIFEANGIPTKEPIDICKKYYDKVVLEDPTIPYADRALQSVYQWTVRNLARFERSIKEFGSDGLAKGAYETYGWITKDSIYYDEGILTKTLESMGFNYSRVKEDWKKGIIDPYVIIDKETKKSKIKSYASPTTINGKRIRGIRININTLADRLDMEEPIFEIPKYDVDQEPNEMHLIEKCNKFLHENPKYKSIEYTNEQAAEGLIKEYDQIELIYGGKDYIVQAMKLCKQGCRNNF